MYLKRLFPEAPDNGYVLVIGELLLEFIPGESKMQLSDPGAVMKTVSGSSGIYACAAAGFGLPCSFIGKLGNDPFSQLARKQIASSGVSTDYITIDPSGKLGLSFVEYTDKGRNYAYYRTDSVGSRLCPEDLSDAIFENAYIMHLPGMLLELSDSMRETCFRAVELAKKHHVLISFDPNLRKEMAASPETMQRIKQILALSDIIEPTLEEGQLITGCTEIPDVLAALHAAGPRLVALTRDKRGAILSYGQTRLSVDGIDVPVIDPTGAGDTFAAALAYSLINDLEPAEALRFCNCAATLVCMKRGTVGLALPTLQQAHDFLCKTDCPVHFE